MNKRILITGASVAGPTVAWWLQHYGFEVTVLEKQPKFRDGGQNIDVRGVATSVLERMGLLQAVKDCNTGEQGFSFVDSDNKLIAEFGKDLGNNGFTSELEILRGQLAGILYDHTREQVEYRFDDSVKRLEELETGLRVFFENGEPEHFDLVIVAEGANSSTRQLLFSAEVTRKPYDLYIAYFTIPHSSSDNQLARWYNAAEGRSLCLRPDNTGTTRALLSWQHTSDGLENLPPDQQKKRLQEIFDDAGWEAPRLLAGLDEADDFYLEMVSQVKMPSWSKGRVVLLGDAAWCAGPFGVGTTEAIVGGYVLAGELHRYSDDHKAAFLAYEDRMRPYVEKGQDVPKINTRISTPQTKLGVTLLNTALKVAAAPGIRQIVAKVTAPPSDDFELPEYTK